MTSPIIDFIEARLAEDEATAKAATPGPWTYSVLTAPDEGFVDHAGGTLVHSEGTVNIATAIHIALHDPARVLREVAAKREMLSSAARSLADADKLEGMGVQPADVFTIRAPAEYTLSLLVAPYSDHSDFDPNWSTT